MGREKYVQIGSSALRAPDGTPYPSVPIYIKVDESAVDPESGLTEGEKELFCGYCCMCNMNGVYS